MLLKYKNFYSGTTLMELIQLFCEIDDFCQIFYPQWEKHLLTEGIKQTSSSLSPSEIMTIIVFFHKSHYRHFKSDYKCHVNRVLRNEFPKIVSDNRFVELMKTVLVPLCAFLNSRRATSRGIAFIDSTSIKVCDNRRIKRHQVFEGIAKRGKSSMGWFYGFK